MSVVVGTIDACLSSGPKATLSMRVGARAMSVVFWFGRAGSVRIFEEAVAKGKFTFWSKVFDSIGGCRVLLCGLSFTGFEIWTLLFT